MSKFGNKKTLIDGIWFDSKKEAKRYQDLVLMQKAKLIRNLMRQQPFELIEGVKYIADFTYFDDTKGGEFIIEDVKGFKTDVYKIKKKLMKHFHNVEILET